jgi:hypothetical protein
VEADLGAAPNKLLEDSGCCPVTEGDAPKRELDTEPPDTADSPAELRTLSSKRGLLCSSLLIRSKRLGEEEDAVDAGNAGLGGNGEAATGFGADSNHDGLLPKMLVEEAG